MILVISNKLRKTESSFLKIIQNMLHLIFGIRSYGNYNDPNLLVNYLKKNNKLKVFSFKKYFLF